jgi:hypothetical protein
LVFAPGDLPLLYLTHNPGRSESFQHRAAVDSEISPLRSDVSYEENARTLGLWYSGQGQLTISPAARNRVSGMNELSATLGFDGVRQLELFPLHSRIAPPEAFLFGAPDMDPPLSGYRACVSAILDTAPIIVGLCGSAADPKGRAVRSWLSAMGMELSQAQLLALSQNASPPSVGAFIYEQAGKLRVLVCRQGSNGLPGRSKFNELVGEILKRPVPRRGAKPPL